MVGGIGMDEADVGGDSRDDDEMDGGGKYFEVVVDGVDFIILLFNSFNDAQNSFL